MDSKHLQTDSKLLVLLLKYISETNVNEDKQLAELTSTNQVNLSTGRTAFLRKERKEWLYAFSLLSGIILLVFDKRQFTDSSSKTVDNIFTETRLVLVAALQNKTNHAQLDTE